MGGNDLNLLKNKVAKNAGWIIGCRLAQVVFALIINLLTARYLGPSNYGVISYAASIVNFVVPIMTLGINNVFVNEILNKPEEEGKTLGTSVVLTLISAICCIIGLTTFAFVVNPGEKQTILVCALYGLLLIPQSFEMVQYWFQSKLLSKYTSLSMLLAYIIVSAYKIFLLVTGKSVYWFAISHALDYSIIAVLLFAIYFKKGGQRLSFSFKRASELFSQGKHYILAGIMGSVLAQTDRIMIKMMGESSDVGFYSAAYAMCGLTTFVFSAIIDSMRPMILEQRKKSHNDYEKNVIRLYSIVIYLSLAQSVVLTIFSKYFILIFYGSAYIESIETLKIISWYTTFSYVGAVRNVWILAEQKQKYLWIINFVGMILNILINLVLIPIWGINGAAVATLLTQIFANVVMGYIIKPIRQNNRLLIKGFNFINIFK